MNKNPKKSNFLITIISIMAITVITLFLAVIGGKKRKKTLERIANDKTASLAIRIQASNLSKKM